MSAFGSKWLDEPTEDYVDSCKSLQSDEYLENCFTCGEPRANVPGKGIGGHICYFLAVHQSREQGKLPINVTLEIVQHPKPNDRWYDVTAVLSWEEAGYTQRMDTAMCSQSELDDTKEAILFLVGDHLNIQEVKEVSQPWTRPGIC